MLALKLLSQNDGQEIYELLQEIPATENGFHNNVKGMPYPEFEDWLKQAHQWSKGINMPDWMVPESVYWLFNEDFPIGVGRIRHYLNDSLRETGGHIGYAIRQSERGKGYGTALLALLMEKSKELGIKQLQVGANVDNIQSNKIITRNSGVFMRESKGKNFYSIDLVNCATSIVLAQLFLEGAISFGSAIAGLTTSAGFGLIVLLRGIGNRKVVLRILAFLYIVAALTGMLLQIVFTV